MGHARTHDTLDCCSDVHVDTESVSSAQGEQDLCPDQLYSGHSLPPALPHSCFMLYLLANRVSCFCLRPASFDSSVSTFRLAGTASSLLLPMGSGSLLPRPALNCGPPSLHLPCSWDSRCDDSWHSHSPGKGGPRVEDSLGIK
jgi:hypothetical protein